jgi:signal transduction histidine kinase
MIISPNEVWATFWDRVCLMGVVFIPSTFLHFNFMLLGKSGKYKFVLVFCYIISSMFLVINFTQYFVRGTGPNSIARFFTIPGPLYLPFVIYFFIVSASGIMSFLIEMKSARGMYKQQLSYLFWSTLLGYSGGGLNYNLSFNVGPPEAVPFGNYAVGLYALVVAYAIVKHRLMDIEVIIRKSIIYSLLVSSVAALYALIVFGLQNLLRGFMPVNEWVLTLIAATAIAFGFKSLEEFITVATDRIFFKKKFDYQKALREISGAMVHLTTMDRLVDLITRIAVKTMRLEGGLALVLNEKSQRYDVLAAVKNVSELRGVSISDNYALIQELRNRQDLLIKDEVAQQINDPRLTEEEKNRLRQVRAEMDKFKSEVMVPTFSKDKRVGRKLIGALSLGGKKSQDVFSREDLELLRTLSNQASVALENAILYDEQVRSREVLLKSEKMVALGTMAAGIVHELKNPLAFMQTVSQLMPQKWDDKDFKETTITMLPEEVLRMKGIVDSLLDYSKQQELKLAPTNLKEVVEGVLTVEAYEIRKNSVEIKKEIPPDLPLVMGEKNSLMQILLNLVSNAIQSMRRGGTLIIRLEDHGLRVALKVTDTGIGIPRERIRDIFNPFYTTRDIGTGLGLAITQKLVEGHKGTIEVSSIVGQGTTFTVYLPVAGRGLTGLLLKGGA